MLTIKDRYEYNQKDLLNWNSETGIFTYKGHMKASPNEIVIIKIIPDGLGKVYEEEVQKLKSLENAGIIAMIERIQIANSSYLIFSKNRRTKPDTNIGAIGSEGSRSLRPSMDQETQYELINEDEAQEAVTKNENPNNDSIGSKFKHVDLENTEEAFVGSDTNFELQESNENNDNSDDRISKLEITKNLKTAVTNSIIPCFVTFLLTTSSFGFTQPSNSRGNSIYKNANDYKLLSKQIENLGLKWTSQLNKQLDEIKQLEKENFEVLLKRIDKLEKTINDLTFSPEGEKTSHLKSEPKISSNVDEKEVNKLAIFGVLCIFAIGFLDYLAKFGIYVSWYQCLLSIIIFAGLCWFL